MRLLLLLSALSLLSGSCFAEEVGEEPVKVLRDPERKGESLPLPRPERFLPLNHSIEAIPAPAEPLPHLLPRDSVARPQVR